jgi:hypothetical protein
VKGERDAPHGATRFLFPPQNTGGLKVQLAAKEREDVD